MRRPSDLDKVFPSGVRIGNTPYGFGVFSCAFIPQGTPIARIAGAIINEDGYGSDYCIDAGNGKVLEPVPPFCYLNHSCEPNCQLLQYVKEENMDEDETLETGALSEDDMDFIDNGDEDEECYYSEDAEQYGPETEESDDTDEEGGEAELWVEAVIDIYPGDELTIDYAWPADRAAKCLCGKSGCRGWIVDPQERYLLE